MLIVDAANVIGARPTGWWRDRPGAARGFVARVRRAVDGGTVPGPVIVVLEGLARAGAAEGTLGGTVEVAHAADAGDDLIVALAREHRDRALVVTADRELRERVGALGAQVVGPGWLLERIPS